MSKKEINQLMGFAKEIHSKSIIKKIKLIKNSDEKIEAMKYSIISRLDIMLYLLRKKIEEKKKHKKDVFLIEAKSGLLNSKIKFFSTTFDKKDFKIAMKLFKEIEKEIKNV